MSEQKYLTELHAEHISWLNTIKFYEDDLKILQERLGEVSVKNTDRDFHAMIERFQNKLIIQKEQIDILKHEISEHEKAVLKNIEENPIASDHRKVDDHADSRDKMQTFELIFNNLRKDLIKFTSKWM
jgi:hypothetical protein